jgi:hypothetical protein
MQILRHSQIAVTMDVYSQVASDSTGSVEGRSASGSKATEHDHLPAPLLYFAAVLASFAVNSDCESVADKVR